jgi:hypothetical protein
LGFTALVVLFFVSCGDDNSGLSDCDEGNGLSNCNETKTLVILDFPMFDTSGYIAFYDYINIGYYDSSADLSVAVNATLVNEKDFTIVYDNFVDISNFHYEYELNNPAAKSLEYAGANINSYYGYSDDIGYYTGSSISIYLAANRTISYSEFADVFGEIDANLYLEIYRFLRYEDDMSVQFADYYAEVTKSGGFFDVNNEKIECYADEYAWMCTKVTDDGFSYRFQLSFDGVESIAIFTKDY